MTILLRICGEKTFKPQKHLDTLQKLNEKSQEEIKDLLLEYFKPKHLAVMKQVFPVKTQEPKYNGKHNEDFSNLKIYNKWIRRLCDNGAFFFFRYHSFSGMTQSLNAGHIYTYILLS